MYFSHYLLFFDKDYFDYFQNSRSISTTVLSVPPMRSAISYGICSSVSNFRCTQFLFWNSKCNINIWIILIYNTWVFFQIFSGLFDSMYENEKQNGWWWGTFSWKKNRFYLINTFIKEFSVNNKLCGVDYVNDSNSIESIYKFDNNPLSFLFIIQYLNILFVDLFGDCSMYYQILGHRNRYSKSHPNESTDLIIGFKLLSARLHL